MHQDAASEKVLNKKILSLCLSLCLCLSLSLSLSWSASYMHQIEIYTSSQYTYKQK